MTRRELLGTVPMVLLVGGIGLLADFGDAGSRTAYWLGVVAATLGYLCASAFEARRR